jgi:uncharacterized protein (TIGR02118 family)
VLRLTVMYPRAQDATFDFEYYSTVHVPMCLSFWGIDADSNNCEMERGIDGPFLASASVRFESREALDAAIGSPGGEALAEDIPNYTNVKPISQISEIA